MKNYYYIKKPLYYDGGNYYTEKDKKIIKEICDKKKYT